MRKLLSLLGVAAMMLIGGAAQAQDEGLYDPVAPEGSAFVRFINAEPELKMVQEDIVPSVGGKKYETVGRKGGVSPYYPVSAKEGTLQVVFDAAGETKLQAGMFVSVVLKDGALAFLNDTQPSSRLKALVSLYNLSGDKVTSLEGYESLSLKTGDGKTEIVAPVANGQNGAREINEVEIALAVFAGDEKVTDLPATLFRRGAAYAVIVTGVKGDPQGAKIVEARTDTTK